MTSTKSWGGALDGKLWDVDYPIYDNPSVAANFQVKCPTGNVQMFKSGATHPVALVASASRDDLIHCGEFISKETRDAVTKLNARLVRPERAFVGF